MPRTRPSGPRFPAVIINDDGVEALPFLLKALYHLRGLVTPIAFFLPDRDRSGCGGYIRTRGEPIPFHEVDTPLTNVPVYVVDGYPAEIAYLVKVRYKPTRARVVSINRGHNFGTFIFNSGCVMGAVQANWLGFASLALNWPEKEMPGPADGAVLASLVTRLWTSPEEDMRSSLWCVNFPTKYSTPQRLVQVGLSRVLPVTYTKVQMGEFRLMDRSLEIGPGDAHDVLERGVATAVPLNSATFTMQGSY